MVLGLLGGLFVMGSGSLLVADRLRQIAWTNCPETPAVIQSSCVLLWRRRSTSLYRIHPIQLPSGFSDVQWALLTVFPHAAGRVEFHNKLQSFSDGLPMHGISSLRQCPNSASPGFPQGSVHPSQTEFSETRNLAVKTVSSYVRPPNLPVSLSKLGGFIFSSGDREIPNRSVRRLPLTSLPATAHQSPS